MKNIISFTRKSTAILLFTAFSVSSFAPLLTLSAVTANASPGDTAEITINKYMDGVQATALNSNSDSFPMFATYTLGGNAGGPSPFSIGPVGFNSPNEYEAITGGVNVGDNYSVYEDTTGIVAPACIPGTTTPAYALVGYTTGTTSALAQAGTPSMTIPTFVGLTGPQYVIVWNTKCTVPPPVEPTATSTQVTIVKYVGGVPATASSSLGMDFPMTATYNATNTGAGTGSYALSAGGYNGDPIPYQAKTGALDYGADYSTNEVLGGDVVGATCSSTQPFALSGYTTGNTMAEAMNATPTMATPTFTDMTTDKYVIVWNVKCSEGSGQIGGEVIGGASTSTGVLAVTSVETVNSTGTANGTFESGWKYIFNITVPTNEPNLAMKFADWMSNVGSTTIPVANNLRISSAQASSTSPVLITAANTYSTPALFMIGDLDPVMIGKQVKVLIETSIPVNSVNGAYSTNYGVKTN